jgi:hypothetical protein
MRSRRTRPCGVWRLARFRLPLSRAFRKRRPRGSFVAGFLRTAHVPGPLSGLSSRPGRSRFRLRRRPWGSLIPSQCRSAPRVTADFVVLSAVAPTCRFADRATPPRGFYPRGAPGYGAPVVSSRSAAAPGVWPRGAAVPVIRSGPARAFTHRAWTRTGLDCLGLLVPLSGLRRSPPPAVHIAVATGRAARGLGVGRPVAAADRGEASVVPFGDTARRGSRLTSPPVFPMGRCSRMRFSRRPSGVRVSPVAARVARRDLL